MARSMRQVEAGVVYHVMARGNNKQTIFLDRRDYKRYLRLIEKNQEKTSITLYCFVLMPNHVHFLLKPRECKALSKFMHLQQTAYGHYFNHRYQRSGHVFQGRFKSVAVTEDPHLVYVSKYIHLNPVESGSCDKPGSYLWSSYGAYFENDRRFDFLDTDFLTAIYKSQYNSEPNGYRSFVDGDRLCLRV